MNWNIGIDIGSGNVRMTLKGRGSICCQSSAVAMRDEEIVALGDEAYAMIGRAPDWMNVVFPMRGGVIHDERALTGWLRFLLQKSAAAGLVRGARLLIARPPEMELTQMRRLAALAMEAGAGGCALVRADLLAAMGAGADVRAPKALMVMQVGAGSVSATLMAMDRVIACESLPFGMARADAWIGRMLRQKHGLRVGERTAEAVKLSLAGAAGNAAVVEHVVGLHAGRGFPCVVDVEAAEIAACLAPVLDMVAELALSVMDRMSPEMVRDVMESGILLTGGGAQVYALDKRIAEATGVACRVADDAAMCVSRGLEKLMEDPETCDKVAQAQQTLMDRRLPGLGSRT